MLTPLRVALLAVLVATLLWPGQSAVADDHDDPEHIGWNELLPGLVSGYDPSSSHLCNAGSLRCVDAVIREMDRRFRALAQDCDHDAVFALTYLRTTEEYRRVAATGDFFFDTPFVNHQDVVFADYYFRAFDAWHRGEGTVPPAWRMAFDAADRSEVSGSGNMLLGMNAHVLRDLPFALAEIGLVAPDGSSRKRDHDRVNHFLVDVVEPVLAEAARRLDPSMDDTQVSQTTLDETTTFQLLAGWREQAWRNAERLATASGGAARALVAEDIEQSAAANGELLRQQFAYRDPLSGPETRDRWCAEHWKG